jgi:hypothetical protein
MPNGISDERARPPATLVEDFGELADDLRTIEAEFGLRSDRVFVVLYGWSGEEVGAGLPEKRKEVELLPPPALEQQEIRNDATSGGTAEHGRVRLEGVSPRLTEADLNVLLVPLGKGEEVFIEIARDGRDGSEPVRRRYRPSGVPTRRLDSLDWVLDLRRVDGNRTTDERRRPWSDE